MRSLPRLFQRVLAIGLVGAVGFLLYAGVVSPINDRFAEYNHSIALSQQLLVRYRKELVDPVELERQRDALKRAGATQGGLLRGDNEAIAGAFVQHFVTTAVEEGGGTLRSIQVLPVKDDSGFRRVTTRAQVNLTQSGLRDVIYKIEAARPYLFVDNLDVRRSRRSRRRQDDSEAEDAQLLVRMDVFGYLSAPNPEGQGS